MMAVTGSTELVVHPNEPLNNLNYNVESCKNSTRFHHLIHSYPRGPALFFGEFNPEIGCRV